MPALCPLSKYNTLAGDGVSWHIDNFPSKELQAMRLLSLLANLTAVTGIYKIIILNNHIIQYSHINFKTKIF